MPVTNWPPATAPAWPPAEMSVGGRLECSDLRTLIAALRDEMGCTWDVPTQTERNLYFPNSVRCDEGHTVVGRMVITPLGVRYPFCVCTNAAHRQLLVLWGPAYCMAGRSGEE